MATRQVLVDLVQAYTAQTGVSVTIESVGGVDAAKRVQAGEALDVVVLASDAIDKLQAAGHVVAGSKLNVVHSGTAVAVRAGAALPDLSSADAVRAAVLAARSVSYSTGPSGVALAQLFERWGIAAQVQERIVTPPPGVPVGSLVASGAVELGFQQLSELVGQPGVRILGVLPDDCAIETVFTAAVATASGSPRQAAELIAFLASAEASGIKAEHAFRTP